MMKRTILLIIALLLVPAAQAAVTINPGQSHVCEGNETVSCGLCAGNTACPEQGVCTIEKEIYPGDTYRNHAGVCDVSVECADCEDTTKVEERNYIFDMFVDKEEGLDVGLTLEIRDFFGTVVGSKQYEFGSADIVSSKYRFNFTCPTEVFMDSTDFEGCSKYFDRYFQDAEPLAMALAGTNKECQSQLITCTGEIEAAKNQYRTTQDLYTDCQSQKNVLQVEWNEMNTTYGEMRAKTDKEIEEARYGYVRWEWFALAGIIAFVSCAYILSLHFGSEL